jgi:hypothetical protein
MPMEHPSDILDSTDALQYGYVLDQSSVPQQDHNPLLGSPSFTIPDLTYFLNIQPDPSVDMHPPAATAQLISQVISSTIPSTAAFHQSTISSSTNAGRTVKTHPCHQCGKRFARRALAEGCQNRHLNLKPFLCRKRCGDTNW